MNTDRQCCSESEELLSIQTSVPVRSCGCSASNVRIEHSAHSKQYITGSVQTSAGIIPQISTQLLVKDYLGAFMVRWGIRRQQYRVDPGLYAVGAPNEYSDVLITSNYKLSFDIVRKNLKGLNVWLLVLDTKGINVWCSAGKGTFGTKELVHRIQSTSLDNIVKRRRIILPQLGAVGVAAHTVKALSGYAVIYGPVRASDIRDFIESGYKATKEMRLVYFGWYDRARLIPNDLVYNLRYLALLLISLSLLSGINSDGFSVRQAFEYIRFLSIIILTGYISGIVLTPLFLPYLLFRSFSLKGFLVGAVVSVFLIVGRIVEMTVLTIPILFFLISGISSFLAMNFTGASTYTSLAGVKKEMRSGVPLQIASGIVVVILVMLNNFFGGR